MTSHQLPSCVSPPHSTAASALRTTSGNWPTSPERCGADVVVDDVVYLDEPFFSDGPIGDAVDDVAAQGVSYFSSAGNEGDANAWQAPVKLVPPSQGAVGANLDLSQVPPELYDGGLQDMNPGRGVDVAQTLSLGEAGGTIDVQWDDPVDPDGATLGDPFFTATGELTDAQPEQSFSFTPTAAQVGQLVQFRTDAIPSGTTDLILTVTAPDGTLLGEIDTGGSPETLATTLEQSGAYTITISGFDNSRGDFTVDVRPILAPSRVTTDFNLLIFDPDGNYLGAIADANRLTGRPSEIASLAGIPELQLAIGRAGTGPSGATTLRYVTFDDMQVSEYSDSLAPATFGHNTAKGATSVAAYDPFRPYLPEYFTSPGGVLPIYFDSDGNRYPSVQKRRKPEIASTDGGNTTFFVADTVQDADSQPNFFGTSAAAPHAAAIAALLLQKSGGPGSVNPDRLRKRLEQSTFTHDLDPNHSSGHAGGLTISADGPQGNENDVIPGSMTDTGFFDVRYTGSVPLRSITFLGESASPTALGTRHPPLSDGIVFDPRPFDGVSPFREDGFPFTIGATSGGLDAASVSAAFSVPAGGAALEGQYRHMTLSFKNGLARGNRLEFGVDRDLAATAAGPPNEGNGADELGGATFIPQRFPVKTGMVFVATRVDGKRITGVLKNRLGSGWTPLDGYGVVDAQRAVLGR